MQMTQCTKCKRLVPSWRKTQASVRGRCLVMSTEIRPLPHYEDQNLETWEVCSEGSMPPRGAMTA